MLPQVGAARAGTAVSARVLAPLARKNGWTPIRADARIGDEVGFAAKPALTRARLARAVDAGVPFSVGDRGRGLRLVRLP